MKILIIGTGYVGTATGIVFCELGHKVTGLDLDERKLSSLKSGKLHFYEPGLEDLLKKHLKNNNLTFTPETDRAIKENDILFICVGTPQGKDEGADLQNVKNAAESIGKYMNQYKVIVVKSTVPVGTTELVTQWIIENQSKTIPFDVISNPEFLRQGSALQDTLNPDRVVIGCSSEKARIIIRELYKELNCPIVETDPKTSELIKYAANSFLALKISYINEIARLCDELGINVNDVSNGIGLDHRIGQKFLNAGIGYGGSCFPKDVNALLETARGNKINLTILETAVKVNKTQPNYFINRMKALLGSFEGKKIALLGLSFKPNTDDIRESPSLIVLEELLKENALVSVHDPVVKINDQRIKQYESVEETIILTDAVVLCTDWDLYREFDWEKAKESMANPTIFDGRNLLTQRMEELHGITYFGIGIKGE